MSGELFTLGQLMVCFTQITKTRLSSVRNVKEDTLKLLRSDDYMHAT